ncbi:MAG: tRNA lysidine(34) synthetase TilS [Clostridia bacterium]|nr:tRNA lysidine(34) synthetase TilS [Clostridia bacterium]
MIADTQGIFPRFAQELMERQLLPAGGGCLIVALSGGLDSVCLLHLFLRYQREFAPDFELCAHHQQHHIRGLEARADLDFCQDLCSANDIRLFVSENDVPSLAKATGQSLEDAARSVRYHNWERLAERLEGEGYEVRIATAHHAQDQAETVLLHLERGSGLAGLTGMAPLRGHYIRPLLMFEKDELEQLAIGNGWAWREDSTNFEIAYHRNFLRREVLPLWQQSADPGLAARIGRTAEYLRGLRGWIDEEVAAKLEAIRYWPSEFFVDASKLYYDVASFRSLASALRPLVLIAAAKAAGLDKDLEAVHVAAIEDLLAQSGGEKKLHLPQQYFFVKRRHYFFFTRAAAPENLAVPLAPSSSSRADLIADRSKSCEIVHFVHSAWCLMELSLPLGIEQNRQGQDLDFDSSVLKNCELRTLKPGDWYRDRSGQRRLLKTWFSEVQMPVDARNRVWLLARQGEILAVGQYPLSHPKNDETVNIRECESKTTEQTRLVWYNSGNIR